MMAFQDYAQPIEYLLDNYFERKRFQAVNSNINGLGTSMDLTVMSANGEPKDDLPDIPCQIIRDSDGRAYKFIYGDVDALESEEEASPVIWQQELVRGSDGKVEKMIITYPDGETATELLLRDSSGKVTDYTIEQP